MSPLLEPIARRSIGPAVADAALAVLFIALAVVQLLVRPPVAGLHAVDAVGVAAAVLVGAPFAVHRYRPYLFLAVTGVAAAVLQLAHYVQPVASAQGVTIGTTPLAIGVSLALAVQRTSAVRQRWAVAATFAAATSVSVLSDTQNRLGSALAVDLVLVVGAALGALGAARRLVAVQDAERRAAVEREREANARATYGQQRARIARELHDIVAHNVSLMVVQTMAADRIQDRDPSRAHELHAAIEQTGRTAVAELRSLMEVLRTDDDETQADRRPQPRLDDLAQLIDSVRYAGLRVEYETTGEPRTLPAGTELAIYRVVQEALTNTLKHAGLTDVLVRLDWASDRLALEIVDAGRRGGKPLNQDAPQPGHGGHGLIGMRERVMAVGGTMSTGFEPNGGFAVRVELPLDAATPPVGVPQDPEPEGTVDQR